MIIVIWKGSQYKYSVDNLECTNQTIDHLERLFFKECLNLYLNSCEILQIITCAFVIPLILHRWISPPAGQMHNTTHSAFIIFLLSSGADIVDFTEYSNFKFLVEFFDGVKPIFGKLKYFD
jgi:hypothetical protein